MTGPGHRGLPGFETADLEIILQSVPLSILILDAELRVISMNDRARSRFPWDGGLPSIPAFGEVLGCRNCPQSEQGCGCGVHCAGCVLREAARRALTSAEPQRDVEATIPRGGANNRDRELHLLADMVPVSLGRGPSLLLYLRDVGQVRQVKEELALKAMVLDQVDDMVVVTDLNGDVIYANEAALGNVGLDRATLYGKNVATFGEDAERGATQQQIIEATLGQGMWRGEVVNFGAAGEERLVDTRTQLIRNAQGEAVAMVGVSTDITARKTQERKLQRSEERFRQLHERLPMGYFALDTDGKYVDCNPAWQEISGLNGACRRGRVFLDDVAEGSRAQAAAALDRVRQGENEQLELGLNGADGLPRIVLCIGRGDEDDGVSHWVAADLTEQRVMEDQLRQAQKMEALGRLAAGVAHDFNNQITVIQGYCDVLLGAGHVDQDGEQPAREIYRASERARSTSNQLLAFSRRGGLKPEVTDLNELLKGLELTVAKMLGATIQFRLQLSPRLPRVLVDPNGVQQAVFNLLINARDALPEGGVITVRTWRRAAEADGVPDAVMLQVKDDGQGIDPALQEKIWEPFYTTKHAGQGTGLGLAMVRKFVEQSGGGVSVASEAGVGAVFTLEIPACGDEATEAGPTTDQPAPRGQSILVVEDDEHVGRVVSASLRRAGYEVMVAGGPAMAIQLAARAPRPFDLLVTDLVMPDLGGEELADLLRSRRQVLAVLYITGYTGEHLRDSQTPLLTKPFTPRELVAMVSTQLRS